MVCRHAVVVARFLWRTFYLERLWPSICSLHDGVKHGKWWTKSAQGPIKYSRRPASPIGFVIQLKLVSVLMHRASGPRRTCLCGPRPWRPVHQDASHPKIRDQGRGQRITRAQGEKRRGCSSLSLIMSLQVSNESLYIGHLKSGASFADSIVFCLCQKWPSRTYIFDCTDLGVTRSSRKLRFPMG